MSQESNKKTYKKFRNFTFTVNNYPQAALAALQALKGVTYAVVGKEVGQEGTPHLQGYLRFKSARTLNATHKRLSKTCGVPVHVEVAGGTWEDSLKYCSKEGDFVEWGKQPKGSGSRTDIANFLQEVKQGKSDLELADSHPKEWARYYKAASKLRKEMKLAKGKEETKKALEGIPLRPWQQRVVNHLDQQNDRKVYWVYDAHGGWGKSWLASWLEINKNAFVVTNGKTADIAHAFDYQEYVVFDFARTREEYVNYEVIEAFKNGRLFSPKYDSQVKRFKPCKVVIFANWLPDRSALSADRWDILTLRNAFAPAPQGGADECEEEEKAPEVPPTPQGPASPINIPVPNWSQDDWDMDL